MVRKIVGVVLPALVVVALATVGGRAEAATNTLDSVSSVDGNAGFYKCRVLGEINTSDSSSTVRFVAIWFTDDPDFKEGSAGFSVDPNDPTLWEYGGRSDHVWHSGYSTKVYTWATVYDSHGVQHDVQSNSLPWTSGS